MGRISCSFHILRIDSFAVTLQFRWFRIGWYRSRVYRLHGRRRQDMQRIVRVHDAVKLNQSKETDHVSLIADLGEIPDVFTIIGKGEDAVDSAHNTFALGEDSFLRTILAYDAHHSVICPRHVRSEFDPITKWVQRNGFTGTRNGNPLVKPAGEGVVRVGEFPVYARQMCAAPCLTVRPESLDAARFVS